MTFGKGEWNDLQWSTVNEVLRSEPSMFDLHMQRFTTKLKQYLGK